MTVTRDDSPGARRILNLGAGTKLTQGAVNVDVNALVGADVVHDLNIRPWPLPDDTFDEVLANDVVEHLDDVIAAFGEIHRVCRQGAIVRVTVPHYSCANAFTDPTHRHYFGYFSFDYLTEENDLSYYGTARFRKQSVQLIFYPTLVNKLIWRLANRAPEIYERRWAWIFPAWFLSIELVVEKSGQPASTDV